MAFYLIGSTTTGYTVADSDSSFLLRDSSYVGSSTRGISATGTNTNNQYTIDGYIVADAQGIYLTGKDGTAAGLNVINVGYSGNIAGRIGIYVTDDRLLLTNNGAIAGNGAAGIRLTPIDVTDHTIINNGTIVGYTDGIDVETSGTSITNTGLIQGLWRAIQLEMGDNFVSNSGLILAPEGGYSAIRIKDGSNDIINQGSISAAGGYGLRIEGTQNEITNSGLISGGDGGIWLADGNANLANTGEIVSADAAVVFGSGSSHVTNSGAITSHDETGVSLNGSGSSLLNSLSGVISGGVGVDEYGVIFLDGNNNSIVNEGLITGQNGVALLENAGNDSANSLTNSGSIIGLEGSGAIVQGGTTIVHNSGSIAGYGDYGLRVEDDNNTILNTGEIFGQIHGVYFSTYTAIDNSGTISSLGIGVVSQAHNNTIRNAETGVITTSTLTDSAIKLYGNNCVVQNSGLISSANSYGIEILGNNFRIDNSGQITSRKSTLDFSSAEGRVINTGELSSFENTIQALDLTSRFRVVNSGTITTEGPSSAAIRLVSDDGDVTIINSGVISSAGAFAIVALDTASGPVEIRNTGTIEGTIVLSGETVLLRSTTGFIGGDIILQEDSSAKIFLGDEDNTVFDAGASADRFDLGGGVDTVDYQQSLSGVHVDLAAGRGFAGDARGDRLIDVENLIGSNFEDLLLGSSVANELNGEDSDDILEGRAGDDSLFGGSGNDDLIGGTGVDTLIGGTGGDDLTGGADADVFVYETIADSALTGIGRDRILDFEQGVDLIDLSALGIQDFIFQSAFTGGGTSEVRYQNVGGGAKTLVQIDVDGDGNADSAIIINNAFFNLTEDDFALGG